eukprot:gnl/MRDRNA2_/MRDRNA2_78851_c0_seq1.p1 gnl/MRDRNA2_/MRDRNA2_78851_c0~~gnl/MRDRNA2_/MRDRNA2_78851_c0_seq1.p1  ORF type:complete len:253 (-),score=24.37 gnl/MRDRNA2_/MRDRNA2_78851_c0_seq1:89-769(-)
MLSDWGLRALSLFLGIVAVEAGVNYTVYPARMNPTCDGNVVSPMGGPPGHPLDPTSKCHYFGKGKSAYNSIEVLRCSSKCLCFRQYASKAEGAKCDATLSLGTNVKESCLGECKADCNGPNCALEGKPSGTRLKLIGSGQICSEPVSDAEYNCETTGMVQLDDDQPRGPASKASTSHDSSKLDASSTSTTTTSKLGASSSLDVVTSCALGSKLGLAGFTGFAILVS